MRLPRRPANGDVLCLYVEKTWNVDEVRRRSQIVVLPPLFSQGRAGPVEYTYWARMQLNVEMRKRWSKQNCFTVYPRSSNPDFGPFDGFFTLSGQQAMRSAGLTFSPVVAFWLTRFEHENALAKAETPYRALDVARRTAKNMFDYTIV